LILAVLFTTTNAVTLWARYTDVGSNGQVTVDHIGMIDLTTGVITPISVNYIYLGGSATIDGISAFDNTNGVFFYTTDGSTTDIYSVHVQTGNLLAPIDLYASSIASLTFDDGGAQLIISYYNQQKQPTIVFWPVDGSTITTLTVPSTIGLTEATTYNSRTKVFYNAVSVPTANNITIWAFQAGAIPKASVITNCPIGYVIDLFIDSNQNLVGMGESFAGTLKYYWVTFDMNKLTCAYQLLKTSGIVTAATFDGKVLYFNEAINGGDLIHSYNSGNGTYTSVNCNEVVEDLQIQF